MSRRRAILAVRSHAARLAMAAEKDQGAAEVAPDAQDGEELDRDALAAEYERIFDKPPHGRMKAETIRDRIADHDDAE